MDSRATYGLFGCVAVRPKASVWLDGFTKHFLPKNPLPKCFVINFKHDFDDIYSIFPQ